MLGQHSLRAVSLTCASDTNTLSSHTDCAITAMRYITVCDVVHYSTYSTVENSLKEWEPIMSHREAAQLQPLAVKMNIFSAYVGTRNSDALLVTELT